jgi:hypothetical protein
MDGEIHRRNADQNPRFLMAAGTGMKRAEKYDIFGAGK